MNSIRLPIALLAVAIASVAQASPGDQETLSTASFRLQSQSAAAELEAATLDIAGILKIFRPAEINYTDYEVVDAGPRGVPRVGFLADTAVLGIHVKTQLVADVSRAKIACEAPAQPEGYRITLDLSASDAKLYTQIESFSVDLCLSAVPEGLEVSATGVMTEGSNYRLPYGPVSKKLLSKQLSPILDALQTRIGERSG